MHQRRAILLAPLLAAVGVRRARAVPVVRVGTLRFGSVSWELDVMRTHGLDTAAGIAVVPVEYAASQAAQVALQAGAVDTVVQDWLWVSRQRATGADWTLAPTSGALGAVVAPATSPLQSLAELKDRRLGIAGSPLDKSWLILQAYAQRVGDFDIGAGTAKTFGPPPLIAEQLAQGRLDAVLTYWPFAARAEASGMRRILAMEDAVEALGIPAGVPFVGWVFSDAFAAKDPAATRGFVAASAQARAILTSSDAEWDRIAPLTGASGPDELARLRAAYRRGAPPEWNLAAIPRLYDILSGIGGPALVGPATHLSPGTLWAA